MYSFSFCAVFSGDKGKNPQKAWKKFRKAPKIPQTMFCTQFHQFLKARTFFFCFSLQNLLKKWLNFSYQKPSEYSKDTSKYFRIYQKSTKIGKKLGKNKYSAKWPKIPFFQQNPQEIPQTCGIVAKIRILRTIPQVWEHWFWCWKFLVLYAESTRPWLDFTWFIRLVLVA